MPLLTLHLLRLQPAIDIREFVRNVRNTAGVEVVVASRARRFIIQPSTLDVDHLTRQKWDLLLLLRSTVDPKDTELLSGPSIIPPTLQTAISDEYWLHAGIPSRLLAHYPELDTKLKQEAASVPLTGSLDEARSKSSSQNLELSPALVAFMDELVKEHDKPVTMLNLLHFHPGGKQGYFKYGQGFGPVASKRGGNAKLVGNVVKPPTGRRDSRGENIHEESWWNEISIVHYPSIRHFCDMLAGEDYQEINSKHRLGALRDTLLLCTTELDVEHQAGSLKL
ncbi:hypothetical protein FQN57_004700 [Myotisia sp. PD_48]|nr:hypothetical protein FQN57_004700 [Myotisia sp. PD_48]